jgi:hypothetical protein
MMIIKCGYKQENSCLCYEETIEEVEKDLLMYAANGVENT